MTTKLFNRDPMHIENVIQSNEQTQQTSVLIVTFFALSSFYFLLTVISTMRWCQLEASSAHKTNEPNIIQTFLSYISLTCIFRLVGFSICTAYYFLDSQTYIKQATYEQIQQMNLEALNANETLWLPLEPEHLTGINEAPFVLVLTVFTPEVFVLITYLALVWLCFSAYIDAHDQGQLGPVSKMNGQLVFRSVVCILVILQIVLVTLYMAQAIDAQVLLVELVTLELIAPICVIFGIMYYQCKYSGVPQARFTEPKTRTLTTLVVIWSILRIFQCWNGLYTSRQFLGMTLLLSGYGFESYLFVPFSLILQFLFLEVIPFFASLDQNFINRVTEKNPNSSLVEPLFETTVRSRLDISYQDGTSSLIPSYEQQFGHYSPNQHHTPGANPHDMISDASSVADFPYSQQDVSRFSQNLGSITDTHYSTQSFSFPNSIFTSSDQFSLYEQYNKGEKQNPLGPLFKVKPLDEENQPSFPLVARVIYFKMVQHKIIDDIFREATTLQNLKSKYLLPIEGMCFNKKTNVMHIFFPQKISLFEYLHESGITMSAEDKRTIATNIARAMASLHSLHQPPAHTHLCSKNIMLNPSDMHIYVADYNLKSLKKFAKLFAKYQNLSAWTACEILTCTDQRQSFYDQSAVDYYSFGMVLYEIETGEIPFAGMDLRAIKKKLREQMRPMIPAKTDKRLANLIRRCWQDNIDQRPNFELIEDILVKCKFSN